MFEIPRRPTEPEIVWLQQPVPRENPERLGFTPEGPEIYYPGDDTGYIHDEPDGFTLPVVDYYQWPESRRPGEDQPDSDADLDLVDAPPHDVEDDAMPEARASIGDVPDKPRDTAGKAGERSRSALLPPTPGVIVRHPRPADRPETVHHEAPAAPRPADAPPEEEPVPDSEVVGAIPPVESPSVPDALSDIIGIREDGEQEERDEARGVITPVDWLTGQLVDVGMSGLESSLWKVGEELADRLHSVGPHVVRGLYLTKQVVEMFKGYRSGDGFYFKVSVPGLDLPLGLELIFRVRLGFLNSDSAGYGLSAEIQVFEPWFPDLDVKHELPDTAGKLGRGIPPAYTPAPRRDDPWRVWLVLIGDGLILDLAGTLADATGTPVDEMTARLLAFRACGRTETRLASPGWM